MVIKRLYSSTRKKGRRQIRRRIFRRGSTWL